MYNPAISMQYNIFFICFIARLKTKCIPAIRYFFIRFIARLKTKCIPAIRYFSIRFIARLKTKCIPAIRYFFHTFHSTYGRKVFPNYTQALQKLFILFIAPKDEMYTPTIPKLYNNFSFLSYRLKKKCIPN